MNHAALAVPLNIGCEINRVTDQDGDLIGITATGNIEPHISNNADLCGELTASLPTGSANQKITLDVVINGVEFTAIAEWHSSKHFADDWVVNDIRTKRNADFIPALIVDDEDPIEPTVEFNLNNIQSVSTELAA